MSIYNKSNISYVFGYDTDASLDTRNEYNSSILYLFFNYIDVYSRRERAIKSKSDTKLQENWRVILLVYF